MTDTTDTVFHRDIKQRPGYLAVWEKHRFREARWLVELFAEAVSPSQAQDVIRIIVFNE